MDDEMFIRWIDDQMSGNPWLLLTIEPTNIQGLDLKCLAGGGIASTDDVFMLLEKALQARERREVIKETHFDA